MGTTGFVPGVRQPDELRDWRVVFFERATFWWARFVPGRFKHVAAYARSGACCTTVIYDVTLTGTRVYVLPDGPAGDEVLDVWLASTTVVRASQLQTDYDAWRPRLAFTCVTAVCHLIGARCGAVTPTGFYRALIRQGAEIISDGVEYGAPRSKHAIDLDQCERAGG